MKFLLLFLCFGSQLNILFAKKEAQPAMTYKVDLGLPPIERSINFRNHNFYFLLFFIVKIGGEKMALSGLCDL